MNILLFFFLSLTTSLHANEIALVEIKGSINPGSSAHFQESLRKAQDGNYEALVLHLDTPGGLLSSTRDMIQAISASRVPVIVYVAPGGASATSAGALISVSAHVVAMAPGTNIGAAHPVQGGGQDIKGDMATKATNDTAAMARSQATLRGRNVQLAEDMVTKSTSLSADEAVKGRVVDLTAKDLPELLEKLEGRQIKINSDGQVLVLKTKGKNIRKLSMGLGHKLLHLLADPNISTLLMALAGIALYAEISSGFTLIAPGVVGVLCGILAFVSLQLLPINIGGLLLFVAGVGLLIAEAFITSYGTLTVGGMLALVVGALFLIDPANGGGQIAVSWMILGPIIGGLTMVMLTIAYLFGRERQARPNEFNPLLGHEGTVESVSANGLEGKVFVQGELWDFLAQRPISKGQKVIVESRKDLHLIVK